MSTSPVSYCWAMAATSPWASRLSRAAILGSSDDGRTASLIVPSLLDSMASLAGARPGPRWLREAGPRRRDTATAPGAPYAAFGPAPAAFGPAFAAPVHGTSSPDPTKQ